MGKWLAVRKPFSDENGVSVKVGWGLRILSLHCVAPWTPFKYYNVWSLFFTNWVELGLVHVRSRLCSCWKLWEWAKEMSAVKMPRFCPGKFMLGWTRHRKDGPRSEALFLFTSSGQKQRLSSKNIKPRSIWINLFDLISCCLSRGVLTLASKQRMCKQKPGPGYFNRERNPDG